MTSESTAKAAGTAVTGHSANRQDFARLVTLNLCHFCVKMFLHSLWATILQIDASPMHWFALTASIILHLADVAAHLCFVDTWQSVTRDTHLLQLVHGAALIVAYNLVFLRFAKDQVDILRIGTWYTFLFDFGCVVELKLGLVQKLVNALVDM